MDGDLAKNTLIGLTTVDTLANLSAVIALLGEMEFYDDVNESCQDGLFIVHSLIKNALEYEIKRIKSEAS